MASNILMKSTTMFFLISCALISTTNAIVKDTDGEPLINGGLYYILPQNIGIGGGLSLKPKSEDSPCPLFITRDKDETFRGIPVRISSPLRIGIIATSMPINIVFKDTPNVCMRPLGWTVTHDESSGKSYVITGGRGEVFSPSETFTILKVEGDEEETYDDVYKIQHAAGTSDVIGIFHKDGLLGITRDDTPLFVVFKKAYDDVLLMKV